MIDAASAAFTDRVSLKGRRWVLQAVDDGRVSDIAREVGGDELLARLLALRGVPAFEARAFLEPKLRDLFPDPAAFADMEKAAEAVLDAVLARKKVTVFADYDVDGGTSSAQLARYFRDWGHELGLYVPDRLKEGYGPSPEAFHQLKAEGCELVITVDCGAAAFSALETAEAIDLPVIVIDHHLMQGRNPPALALVNPNRPDCNSGCGHLAAAGVVFVFLVALNRIAKDRGLAPPGGLPDPMRLLDLCALGTICDMAPLEGVNRAFVSTGLKVLARGENPGLRALCDVAGIGTADSTYHAGFILGPRLNAGGRVGDPWLAAKLLATNDREEAIALAEQLHGLNAARREVEAGILAGARAQAESQLEADGDLPALVVSGEDWHPGIIGIVAGRLKDNFHRPSIVIGHGPTIGPLAKGSARSVPGINLGGLIADAVKAGRLQSGGGHAMAGGLSVLPEDIAGFRDWLLEAMKDAGRYLTAARELEIAGLLTAGGATPERLERIAQAGPFGAGAPEPVFALTGVSVEGVRRIGENHLKFTARDETGKLTCLAWRSADEPLGEALYRGGRIDLAGQLKRDDWQGRQGVRFDVIDALERT